MSTTDRSEYIDLIETKIESNSDQFCTRGAAAAAAVQWLGIELNTFKTRSQLKICWQQWRPVVANKHVTWRAPKPCFSFCFNFYNFSNGQRNLVASNLESNHTRRCYAWPVDHTLKMKLFLLKHELTIGQRSVYDDNRALFIKAGCAHLLQHATKRTHRYVSCAKQAVTHTHTHTPTHTQTKPSSICSARTIKVN